MTSGRRRGFITLPVAAAVFALGAGALASAPAQAADTVPLPGKQNTQKRTDVPQAELLDTIKGSAATLEEGASGAPERPAEGGTASTPPAPGRTVDPKIIGGVEAPISEAPWMVQLHYYDDKGTSGTADDESYFCGGTLVAPAKVLTAAHCVDGLDWSKNGAVLGGTAKLPVGNDLNGGQAVGVWRQWVHPAYDDAELSSDVAVLTLGATLPYKTLQPAAGAETALYKEGTRATVYGWGRTSSTSDEISPTLRKATVPVNADATCTSFYGSEFVPGKMTCAGDPAVGQDEGTVSPCNGDSGGPLVVNGRIAGVVSWGVRDCVATGAYSVYSKVSSLFGQINPRVDDANLNFDTTADLFARQSKGEAFEYYSTGKAFGSSTALGNWGAANLVRQVDWDRDFYQDYVYRVGNDLYWFYFNGSAWAEKKIGTGWSSFKNILFPGDVTGDGNPDLVGIDSTGTLVTYPGKGDGTFAPKAVAGSGWGSLTLFGKGDYSGDGIPDLLARDGQGQLWLYAGRHNVNSPFANKVLVGTGWNFTAYVGTGDNTGDGNADITVRDSTGAMWFYPSSGSATKPFGPKLKAGTGWNGFNLFG